MVPGSAIENVDGDLLTVGREADEAKVPRIADLAELRSVAPIPDEPRRRDSGLVGQDSIPGHRKIRLTKIAEIQEIVGHRIRIAGRAPRAQVERLRHQSAFTREEKVTWLGVDRSGVRLQDGVRFRRVERSHPAFARFSWLERDIEEAAPVWEEVGPQASGTQNHCRLCAW